MIKIVILMIFCHLIDDYFLQGKFAYLKQKSWWIKACNDDGLSIDKYKNDYKMALFEQSLEWSIAILLPAIFILNVNNWLLVSLVMLNTICHCIVDDLKANQLRLNLIQDQIIHFIQIFLTAFVLTIV